MATVREKRSRARKKASVKRERTIEGGPDERTIDLLVNFLALGLDQKSACTLAGITTSSFNYYIRNNKKFARLIKAAKVKCEEMYLTPIRNAAMNGDWRAAAWALCKLFPKTYGGQGM